ncbi:hypothetical protein BSAF29S_07216 [Bacillus safensis subsp. safensis]
MYKRLKPPLGQIENQRVAMKMRYESSVTMIDNLWA